MSGDPNGISFIRVFFSGGQRTEHYGRRGIAAYFPARLVHTVKALETELGKQLFIRGVKGSRKIVLTEEGMILRRRAEEIISLMRRTEEEITGSDETIAGNVLLEPGKRKPSAYLRRPPKKYKKNIQISNTTFPAATRNMYWTIWIKD